jgi:hypothetical protein
MSVSMGAVLPELLMDVKTEDEIATVTMFKMTTRR